MIYTATYSPEDNKLRLRLVAICANGPRQQEQLKRGMVIASGGNWEELPEGTFEGTGVRTAMITLTAAAAPRTTLFD